MHGLVRCKHERRCSRARGEDVSFRDVKIEIPDRNYDQGMWLTSCTGSVGFGGFEKNQLSSCLRTRVSTLRAGRGQTNLCATGAARWLCWELYNKWRDNPHYLKLQNDWSLTIRLVRVISGHSLVETFLSVEMHSVYSAAPAMISLRKYCCPNKILKHQSLWKDR